MIHDVIVIGGSYAGMAAALQLLRARRKVLVIDAGQRRNRFAATSHGFLGSDGKDPAVIAEGARRQLEAYSTLIWQDDAALEIRQLADENFEVRCWNGSRHIGRRIILATGVSDALPQIEGLDARWGRHVFHCPYCHGYELNQGKIGVIATGEMSLHQAEFLPEWGETTFFLNGALSVEGEAETRLRARGVRIEARRIRHLEGDAEIILEDGDRMAFSGLFLAPRIAPSSPIAEQIGCVLEDGIFGQLVRRDAAHQTSVPGVYACGDVAQWPHSVSLAVGDGALTGAMVHRSLVF